MEYAVAVIDIGKTNKKLLVFDQALRVLHQSSTRIETFVEEGLDIEDVGAIEEWILAQLAAAAARFPIRAVTVSCHGATVVCVGEDGNPSVPPVAYTNEVDEDFHKAFSDEIGAPEDLHVPTATAEVRPLINMAKLLFFKKRRWPVRFARTRRILPFPQYFSWRLSDVAAAEVTYLGSHTYLLDPRALEWSAVVDRLDIRELLPGRLNRPTDVLGTISARVAEKTGLDPSTLVLAGIHDSNASILPYLITRSDEFVLNSTGTWCVAMHPSKEVSFAAGEVGKMVFFNISYRGQPIKTSILMAGLEYDAYLKVLSGMHSGWGPAAFNRERYERIAREQSIFVLPSIVRGSGQFPDSVARIVENDSEIDYALIEAGTRFPNLFLSSPDDAIAAVNMSMAIQTVVALRRTGLSSGTPVYVEGGFRRNDGYLAVLSSLLPENPISLTGLEEATSVGAALTAAAAVEECDVATLGERVEISEEPVEAAAIAGVEAYAERLLAMVG